MFFSTILFKVFTGGRFIWAWHPFFLTHGLMHTTMIVRNFTRERIPSEEKDDPCVFLDFFVFWRLCGMYLPDVKYFFAINNGVPSKCSVFFSYSIIIRITSRLHFLPVIFHTGFLPLGLFSPHPHDKHNTELYKGEGSN